MWLPQLGPPHSWLAAEASQKVDKSLRGHLARAETRTNQFGWLSTIPPSSLKSQPNCCDHLAKRLGRIKCYLVAHDVVTRPGQLVRHRFARHRYFSLGQLALIITLHFGIESNGKMGRLGISPAQVRIAIFHIALPLAFAVAHFRAVHTATI